MSMDIARLEELSNINLTEQEKTIFLAGFTNHLTYVAQLLKLDTTNVMPSPQILPPLEEC